MTEPTGCTADLARDHGHGDCDGLAALGRRLRRRDVGCLELVRATLARIERRAGELGAFLSTDRAGAEEAALRAQQELDRGLDRGPLHGIPWAVKDLFDVAGERTTGGTPLLDRPVARRDAAAVRKLRAAGAVLVGRTHTGPLAATILGINSTWGTPRNPWHPDHVPGGSSSGAAVAVAAGLVPCALGSDTGGSVRVPASFCGVVGWKAAVGRVDTRGLLPLSPSLDSVGVLAATTADAAIVHRALLEEPPTDEDATRPAGATDLRGLRIGLEERFFEATDPEVAAAVRAAVGVFEELGASVLELPLPELEDLYDLMGETSLIATEAYPLHRRVVEHPESDWVVHWLRDAAGWPVSRVEEAWRRRARLAEALGRQLATVDALVLPTTPVPAPRLADCAEPAEHRAVSARVCRHTLVGNLAGWCGLSLPCGLTGDGLPIGLMIYATAEREARCLRLGRAFEAATPGLPAPPHPSARSRP